MDTTYYGSNYLNVYKTHRDTCILFNGFTGAIDEVTGDLGTIMAASSSSGMPISEYALSKLSLHEKEFLKKRGHLADMDHKTEIDKFCRFVDTLNKHVQEGMKEEASLMLVPSYNCNLACGYCYQGMLREGNSKNRIMTKEQVDFIFNDLINQLFPEISDKARISIMLYGGEPFLRSHAPALRQIIGHTKKHQMKVSAISNTTTIHEMPEFFGNDIGLVNSVQVSFDGNRENHDKSRIGLGKTPTYNRIIENIHILLNKRVRIGIRVNIDRNSVSTLNSLIEDLKKEQILGHPLVNVYAWVIHSHFNQVEKEKNLSPIELANYMKETGIKIETPVGRRERRVKRVFDAVSGIPLRRTAFCMKCLPYSFVYDPYENIYSCYEEAGHSERRAGYVGADRKVIFSKTYHENLNRHVASIEECKKCSLALTCGGGCPFAAEQREGTVYASDCDCHKECMEEAVKNLFKARVEVAQPDPQIEKLEELFPYA